MDERTGGSNQLIVVMQFRVLFVCVVCVHGVKKWQKTQEEAFFGRGEK